MNRLQGRDIAAIASFDSFGKTAMSMLSVCRKQGARTTLYLLEIQGRRLSRRQLQEIQRIRFEARIDFIREYMSEEQLRQLQRSQPIESSARNRT